MPKAHEKVFNTLVRPQLEYASAVWDPHTIEQISQIEQVLGRAVRWTVSNFDWEAIVTQILQELGGEHWDARLCLVYKIIHG